jgi:hypothetical protein
MAPTRRGDLEFIFWLLAQFAIRRKFIQQLLSRTKQPFRR